MRWLLRVLLNDADRRAVESDLSELFELRRREEGERAAGPLAEAGSTCCIRSTFSGPRASGVSSWRMVMPNLWREVSYAVRGLFRTPAVAATIVLSVGIGLGATTGMVTIVRACSSIPCRMPRPIRSSGFTPTLLHSDSASRSSIIARSKRIIPASAAWPRIRRTTCHRHRGRTFPSVSRPKPSPAPTSHCSGRHRSSAGSSTFRTTRMATAWSS